MQHSFFLWWVTLFILAVTGSAVGVFCALTARQYDHLLRWGYNPDGLTLMMAMRRAVAAPVVPIIWADDAGWSHLLMIVAGGAVAVMVPVLYAGHGGSARFVSFSIACSVLVLLACIDARVYLLPDALTQPLLWLGLVCAWTGLGISTHDSIGGVIAGYVLLAVPRTLWLRWRGMDGVGQGDVKLLAALGAWLGAFSITQVLTVACITGAVFAMVHQRRWRPSGAYPFGPFIVMAGVGELLLASGVHLRL